MTTLFVGIDVAKEKLDFSTFVDEGETSLPKTVKNDISGFSKINELIKEKVRLKTVKKCII